jgi:Fe-Mn family superoxide dismutase
MTHTAKNFEHLIGNVKGLSEKQLRNHFELYHGYVKKLNEIEEALRPADRSKANYNYSALSELQRRRPVAFNGAYLHQLYFENLTGKATKPSSELEAAINNNFGSMTNWLNDALAGLKTANGWVLLTHSRIDNSLQNCVLEEHHHGLFVEQNILLAIDGWEHAYMIDYGIKEADYFKAIQPSLDWSVASDRFHERAAKRPIAA